MIVTGFGTTLAYFPKIRSKYTGTLDFKVPENVFTGDVAGGAGKNRVTLVYHQL